MDPSARSVAVSGASSGIGEATAKAFARRGCRVGLIARRRPELERVAGDIKASKGVAFVYDADLSDGAAAEAVARRLETDIGVPDIVVNCAGAGRWLFAEETSPPEALALIQAPYLAAFLLTRAFLPAMIARGSGRIVNVNSPAAFSPWPGATGYAASRWALRGFTEALRVDLRDTGIGVTQVVAGECESPYWEHNVGARERLPKAGRYFRKLTPDEVAHGIMRAVERNSSMVTLPLSLAIALALNQLWPWPMRALMSATGYRRKPGNTAKT